MVTDIHTFGLHSIDRSEWIWTLDDDSCCAYLSLKMNPEYSNTEVVADGAETSTSGLREIGHRAVWSVSSAKAGNGVDCLRDGRMDTFWQWVSAHERMDAAEQHCTLLQLFGADRMADSPTT